MDEDQDQQSAGIVAVGLLTSAEMRLFGTQLSRVYPVSDDHTFNDLIEAIDCADRERRKLLNSGGCSR